MEDLVLEGINTKCVLMEENLRAWTGCFLLRIAPRHAVFCEDGDEVSVSKKLFEEDTVSEGSWYSQIFLKVFYD